MKKIIVLSACVVLGILILGLLVGPQNTSVLSSQEEMFTNQYEDIPKMY